MTLPTRALACGVALLCGNISFAVAKGSIDATAAGSDSSSGAYAPLFAGTEGLAAARADLAARQASGGWPSWEPGATLRIGEEDAARVPRLRARLIASGDLELGLEVGAGFEEALEQGVRRFQRRHGLDDDGVVGPATQGALAVPLAERLRQIDLNLARRQAMPPSLGARFLLINLPAFELEAIAADRRELAMKMVVGKPTTPSPQLSANATYLKLNPYWNVPPKIATRELAPKEAKEPGHLARLAIRVFRDRDGRDTVDPGSVDWRAFARGELALFLRQEPGPKNSLGRISIQVPNNDNVCLHDTPEKSAFARPVRALSHGCLRLERAFDLAVYLLRGDPTWNAESLAAAIEAGDQRDIFLPAPVPVHVVYWTAFVDADGALQFRDDVYRRDRRR